MAACDITTTRFSTSPDAILATMKVLFIHQNFPGQFLHLAPALAQLPGNQVVALTMREQVPAQWQNIQVVTYRAPRKATPGIHRWLADLESKTVLGEACFHAALELKRQGFEPDCVVAHPVRSRRLPTFYV